VLTTTSQVNLTDLGGGLLEQNTLDPVFDLTFSADLPGKGAATVNFACGGRPAFLPIIQYAEQQVVRDVRVRYSQLTNFVNFSLDNPFFQEEVEVVLRPISCHLLAAPQTTSCN
jgi:hypothetical protein